MNNIELNKKLYNECVKEEVNKEQIEVLIKQGANPLGSISSNDPYKYLYNELIFEYEDNYNKLYELTKIFIENGMIIDYKQYEKNEGNNINPLWDLAFICNQNGLKTLKLLLDNNLGFESAEILVDHIYTDHIFLDESHDYDENLKKEAFEYYEYAMKMILLCGSYPEVLNKSKYIQEMIRLKLNKSENLEKLKSYNDYYMKEDYDPSDKTRILTFYDNNSNDLIWVLDYRNNW